MWLVFNLKVSMSITGPTSEGIELWIRRANWSSEHLPGAAISRWVIPAARLAVPNNRTVIWTVAELSGPRVNVISRLSAFICVLVCSVEIVLGVDVKKAEPLGINPFHFVLRNAGHCHVIEESGDLQSATFDFSADVRNADF